MIQDLGTYVITKLSSYLRTIVIKETVPKKSGELAKSITVRGSGKNTKVGTNKKYARMVHFGSDKPVVIRPRYKKALFWPGIQNFDKKGEPRPVKKVVLYKNKDREANPFFTNAIEKASKNLE